jgi:hypothetical protein
LLRRVLRVTRNDNFYPRLEVLAAAATIIIEDMSRRPMRQVTS